MNLANLRIGLLEGVIGTLDRMPAHLAAGQSADAEHLEIGRAGELAAYFFLRRRGYIVVARDWKSPRAPGDIDLIAWDGDTVCFAEVKTRTSRDVSTAEAAIDLHKRRTLRRLASHYLRHLPDDTPFRFDVLSVYYTDRVAASAREAGPTDRILPQCIRLVGRRSGVVEPPVIRQDHRGAIWAPSVIATADSTIRHGPTLMLRQSAANCCWRPRALRARPSGSPPAYPR